MGAERGELRARTRVRRPEPPRPSADVDAHDRSLEVQRTAGNQAAVAFLAAAQPKLVVGGTGDRYEQAADAVADRVVATIAGRATARDEVADAAPAERLQRAPAAPAAGADSGAGSVSAGTEQTISRARAGGSALPAKTRETMEAAFGADFSRVRVHAGAESSDLNDDLGARAFTVGRDIFFRDRVPDGDSAGDRRLLAHELAHTLQQRATGPQRVQRWPWSKKTSKQVPKYEFLKNPGNVDAFVKWANKQKDEKGLGSTESKASNKKITAEMIRVDLALAPLNVGKPSLEDAKKMVGVLRSSSDPEVKRIVAESEARWRPHGEVDKLEDNFVSEEQYSKKFGGLQQLQGINGILNYYTLGTYNKFQGTSTYAKLVEGDGGEKSTSKSKKSKKKDDDFGDLVVSGPRNGRFGNEPKPTTSPNVPTVEPEAPKVTVPETVPDVEAPSGIDAQPKGKVADLAKQLGGVIGQVRPGGPPPVPKRNGGPPSYPPPPVPKKKVVEKVPLEERKDPRETERKVLEHIKKGEKVPPALLDRLAKKIGKGQTIDRGTKVTDTTEGEYTDMVSKLDPEDRKEVVQAIKDYTADSSQINTVARGMKPTGDPERIKKNIEKIDSMFDTMESKGFTSKKRIVYRLATYKTGQEIPFGSKIKEGDLIADKAYVSTSENRQLLQDGAVKRDKGTRFVKFTIMGSGGANISGGGMYTNATGKQARKMKLGGNYVGQAEILFRRNSIFRVDRIMPRGEDIHLVVTRVEAGEAEGKQTKNAFTGDPITVT